MTGEGPEVASFPQDNAVNYSNNAGHFMLISRASGGKFNLTLTFADTDEHDSIDVYGIEDEAEKTCLDLDWI